VSYFQNPMPIAAVQRGEALSQEFEALYLQHCQLVYRTAYAITGRRQDAEDVLQRIFVKLLERGLTPDVLQHPARYLHRAAVNLSLNLVRERKRRTQVDLESFEIPAPADTRDEARGREARHTRLMAAMATLKPSAVEILVLHYKHGYSDAQIAALLGTSRGVVAVTLYRIRARLKTLLRSAGSEGEET
jgi:RNA polymerase sigma-70 factor (ECF subfamily)